MVATWLLVHVVHVAALRCARGLGGCALGKVFRLDLLTSLLLLALPVLLAHCGLIVPQAMIMSIIGGLLIYATIISFTMFFQEQEDF